MKEGMNELQDMIWENPVEENWKKVVVALKRNSARYYSVDYPHGGIKESKDLTKFFVEVYDDKVDRIVKLPLFRKEGRQLIGSLEFLKWLKQKPLKKR